MCKWVVAYVYIYMYGHMCVDNIYKQDSTTVYIYICIYAPCNGSYRISWLGVPKTKHATQTYASQTNQKPKRSSFATSLCLTGNWPLAI